jgi:hypothetical protein
MSGYASVCSGGHVGRLYLRGTQVHLDVLTNNGNLRVQCELPGYRGTVRTQPELEALAAELVNRSFLDHIICRP